MRFFVSRRYKQDVSKDGRLGFVKRIRNNGSLIWSVVICCNLTTPQIKRDEVVQELNGSTKMLCFLSLCFTGIWIPGLVAWLEIDVVNLRGWRKLFQIFNSWLSCNINVDEILMKDTLLSFEIVSSHNYDPLRSAIHVLETLQEIFFWDGVQKPRHVLLDVRNIVNI
ncbi:uncharacterized protein TNCV_3289151 [Trichonephila clavipes]|nr:uncharacterized protein TNCV_3289151 [Trichonephila clavipes]